VPALLSIWKRAGESDETMQESSETYKKKYGVTPADADHATLLAMIEDCFKEGLETQLEPFPETDREFSAILDELRGLDADQLRAKLDISGWKLAPHGEDDMRCQECMYFLVHRRWCDLPELNLPAEPEWWCRLWRI
tara:strand:+ start:51377 stop:51787 length:411 start_codon:yes stop_codon:yes gene_type:complete